MNNLDDFYLDHIACAVTNLDTSIEMFTHLGLNFDSKREIVESQNVKTAFAKLDQRAHLELLQPLSENGAIAKFLNKRGEGIHHLSFRVKKIQEKQIELEAKGFTFVYPAPVEGANQTLVNFIYPKYTGGILIEISQKKDQ